MRKISILLLLTLVFSANVKGKEKPKNQDNNKTSTKVSERGKALGGSKRLWDIEPTLLELAKTVTISQQVPPTDPQPIGTWDKGTAPNLSTHKLKISLWGPPSQLTLSLGKTDVWDRRCFPEPVLTLAEIRKTIEKGELPPYTHYISWRAYDFPCPKPVGQIILRCSDFEGASQPVAVTHCHNGAVKVDVERNTAAATFTYLPMMTRNLIAIRCDYEGLNNPMSVRLYRHRDTQVYGKSMCAYGGPEPKAYEGYDYSKDKGNGLLKPPISGTDGRYFWIRQQLPAEKTFPNGFEYVMVGCIFGPQVTIETVNGKRGLGTPPYLPAGGKDRYHFPVLAPSYEAIRNAEGSAATTTITQEKQGHFTLLVSVVTSAEVTTPLAEAKRRLNAAAQSSFSELTAENMDWYSKFYQRREKGRVFKGNADFARSCVKEVFRSWVCDHSKKCMPDPSRYEADAKYAYMEQDWAPWHGLPCYDELYYTDRHVRNRSDKLEMWYKLVQTWLPACKKNAREVFDMPGAAILIGYLPPTKADEYPHWTSTWEFCMEISAQVLKVLWDAYDYGGDEKFLSEVAYPAMREVAIFYSHYAMLGKDGYYHVIPTVSAEHWGWTPEFKRNRDSTSALCMFKWLLNTTSDASEILGRDADLRGRWREIAQKIAPYPTYITPEGIVFTDVRGTCPIGVDYNWFAGVTPTLLADEINLDSPAEQKEIMLRTARLVKGWRVRQVGPLLGSQKGTETEQLINSRSGRIHLFPATPAQTTIGFRDMQTRGGFEVSAECIDGDVTYVHIRARRSITCRLMNPWPGEAVTVREVSTQKCIPHEIDMSRGECVIFPAKQRCEYIVERQ